MVINPSKTSVIRTFRFIINGSIKDVNKGDVAKQANVTEALFPNFIEP